MKARHVISGSVLRLLVVCSKQPPVLWRELQIVLNRMAPAINVLRGVKCCIKLHHVWFFQCVSTRVTFC